MAKDTFEKIFDNMFVRYFFLFFPVDTIIFLKFFSLDERFDKLFVSFFVGLTILCAIFPFFPLVFWGLLTHFPRIQVDQRE